MCVIPSNTFGSFSSRATSERYYELQQEVKTLRHTMTSLQALFETMQKEDAIMQKENADNLEAIRERILVR